MVDIIYDQSIQDYHEQPKDQQKGRGRKYVRHINKKKEAANKVLSFHKKTKLVLENYHKGLIIEDVEFSGEIDQQKKKK